MRDGRREGWEDGEWTEGWVRGQRRKDGWMAGWLDGGKQRMEGCTEG